MGTDVHMHPEKLNKESGKWESTEDWPGDNHARWEKSHVDRDYELFGIIADGVRYQKIQLALLVNGMPDDPSEEVAASFLQWEGDAHSHCHRTLEELERLVNAIPVFHLNNSINFLEPLNDLIKQFKDEDIPSNEQRLIYWFDN